MAHQTSERAAWTTAFINNLPDSSFLYIEPGGSKDADGKTTPRTLRHFPYKDASGAVDLPHLRNALARIPQSNLSASLKASLTTKAQGILSKQPGGGRSVEFRARPSGYELRYGDEGEMPTLVGHVAVFDEWTEINSVIEGRFMERMAPGAFTKTIKENRDAMRVLFQHGQDPQVGEKPLGPIANLTVSDRSVDYEVPLFDTSYNRDLVPLLAADPPVLGSSFRFKVMRESVNRKPARSDYNPKRLPERTVHEVRMQEFGPVTFPAYAGAKAGLRSLTDRMLLGPAVRMDSEDLSTLAQMIVLGAAYVDEQDEPGDAANIPVMQGVLQTLVDLQGYELAEDEGMEAEDEEASSHGRHAPTSDAAPVGTSDGTPRPASWPLVPSLGGSAFEALEASEDVWNHTT